MSLSKFLPKLKLNKDITEKYNAIVEILKANCKSVVNVVDDENFLICFEALYNQVSGKVKSSILVETLVYLTMVIYYDVNRYYEGNQIILHRRKFTKLVEANKSNFEYTERLIQNLVSIDKELYRKTFKNQIWKNHLRRCNEALEVLKNKSKILGSIVSDDNFLVYFERLHNQAFKKVRSSRLVEALVYLTLVLYYDVDGSVLTNKEFMRLLELPKTSFLQALRLLKKSISIDKEQYTDKVIFYCEKYLTIFQNYYKFNVTNNQKKDIINKCKDFYAMIINGDVEIDRSFKVESNVQDEVRKFLSNGFDINAIFNKNYYNHFLPQYLSFAFIILFLKQEVKAKKINLVRDKKRNVICREQMSKYINLPKNSTCFIVRLYRKAVILQYGIYIGFNVNSKEIYIQRLKEIIGSTKKSHNDASILLDLFMMLKLTPREFGKNIIPFRRSKGEDYIIKYLQRGRSLSGLTYRRIGMNIWKLTSKLDEETRRKAVKYINEIVLNRVIQLRHRNIKFDFEYRMNRLKLLRDIKTRVKLKIHFINIDTRNYPINLFNSKKALSGSKFKLKGSQIPYDPIRFETIENELVDILVKKGKIYSSEVAKNLVERTKKVVDQNKTTDHYPTLKTLMKMIENIISLETPIWFKKCMIGHIDLLAVNKRKVMICEYKPTIEETFRGLAQVCIYGYLISRTLDISMDRIECIIFSSEESLCFKPTILEDILRFVRKLNKQRKANLRTLRNTHDLEQELNNFLFSYHYSLILKKLKLV